MRKLVLISSFLTFLYCSDKKTESVTTDTNRENTAQKDREIDSLKNVIASKELEEAKEAAQNSADENPSPSEENPQPDGLRNLSGKHSLTLQWIGWDRPGSVMFTKTGPAQYKISGNQKNGKDYLRIEGVVHQISDSELQFEGTIETFVESNGGKCLRTGPQQFLVTQNRKYWRLQNMTECFGLTDYVDIYF